MCVNFCTDGGHGQENSPPDGGVALPRSRPVLSGRPQHQNTSEPLQSTLQPPGSRASEAEIVAYEIIHWNQSE